MSNRVAIAVGLLLIAFTFTTGVVVSHRAGPRGETMERCHARGPAYHYWTERQRCVRYVP